MPNEMTPQECAERLEFLQSFAIANCEPWVPELLRSAASIVRQYANGELKPVVHGEWLNFYNDFATAECSECGECYEVSPDEKPREDYFNAFKQFYKFCPSCGALMDGKEEKHDKS